MGKKMVAILCIVGVFLAASVTATQRYQSDTPLYIARMEQASSKMHFLPAAVNEITYTTTKGYTLDYDIPEMKGNDTDAHPIHWDDTWYTCDSCWLSCFRSCSKWTCDSCNVTCVDTFQSTCSPTCPDTCLHSCGFSCFGTC